MGKAFDSLNKLATRFEHKLEKHAQEVTYPFNPDQDLLGLKSKDNLNKANSVAQNALPETFKGKVTVGIKILKNKSFAISANVKEVSLALKLEFDNKIKELLANAGPNEKDVMWNWFSFIVE